MSPSFLLLLLAATSALCQEVKVTRSPRDASHDSIKVVISEGCVALGEALDDATGGKELSLSPGAPLVLTHQIRLVPPGPGSGSCGCDGMADLRERVERLEREVSALREKCGDPEAPGCCSSRESKGSGCSIAPESPVCPNDCSDQGRCVDGRCQCFPGFTGPDCGESQCPGNCGDRGRCVDGQCECDPGFTGPDCGESQCPGNCNSRGRCVNGRCQCNPGFTGPDCGESQCPGNCANRGRCVNGRCQCDPGFTGPDCGESQCPGNCANRGRCVNGRCQCDPGFTGPDCSRPACPDNCHNRGRCVGGKCVCDPGFGGENCADKTCPGNCNSRGRCVDGRCVCDGGFKGDDCSEKACPNDCSARGTCVDGRCVCKAGFTGDDCSAKGCPGNCNNRGRCIKGKCVCRRGFSGPDCGQCQDGLTGANCDTVMSAVEELRTKDLTQSSVSVVWTQPPVQYESYLLIFTSQKDEAEVQAEVPGSQSSFTQTGLAPGQVYTVKVTGKTGERRGAEGSTQFATLPAGPSDLRVVKTSTSSVVVQWEPSPSAVDRYRLTVSRGDGAGRGQELTFDPGTSSAHITQLEAGLRYDIALVAEKGRSQSEPVSTHAVPGSANVLVSALAVSPTSGRDGDQAKFPVKNVTQPGIPSKPHRPNGTTVIRRIELKPSPGENTEHFPQRESHQTPDSGTDFGSKSGSKEGGPGTDLTSPGQKATCLNRIRVTHSRPGLKDQSSGCRDSGTDDPAESASGGHGNELGQPGTNQPNTDLEVASRDVAQHDPLRKLLTDTFRNVNITAFDIRLSESEPSTLDADAETLARQIMQGSKPRSTIQKSVKPSQHSDKPQITSLFFVRSPNTTASPTSGDDSRTENAKPSLSGEGGAPSYRRTPPSRTVIRRLRPNPLQFQNKTSKGGDGSLPTLSKMSTTAAPVMEKATLNDEDVTNVDNNRLSEGENQDRSRSTKQGAAPVRRFPLRLDGQNLANLRPFQNRTHPNQRFFRRPVRILQNKTESAKLPLKDEAASTTEAPPGNIALTRTGFNRSRPAFPRRLHPYAGPFQNRTRLLFRPPQGGPVRRNWTADRAQNEPNTGLRERTKIGMGATHHQTGARNENVNLEDVRNRLNDQKLLEDDTATPTSSTETPGKQKSDVIGQPSDSGHRHGPGVGETETQGETATGRLDENVQKLPEDKLQIAKHSDSHDISEDDMSLERSGKLPEAKDAEEARISQEIEESFAEHGSSRPNLVASFQAPKASNQVDDQEKPAKTDERQSNPRDGSGATVFRRPLKPGGHPTQTRRRILPQNQVRNMTRTGFRINATLNRGVNVRRDEGKSEERVAGTKLAENDLTNENLGRRIDGSIAAERNLVATTEQDETETGLNGGENALQNEKLTMSRRTQPNQTVVRRLRPTQGQFRNKTGPSLREGDGSLSPSSKMIITSTDRPVLATEKPSLSSRNAINLDDNSVSGGESKTGPAEDRAVGNLEESPGESRGLDAVFPETDYKVTVLGKGSGVLSGLHKLVISTGPEPPSDLVFSHVTEDSVTVSWTRPKSQVSGFKVTYTHSEDGEPVSVSLDQGNSSVGLSRLTPGSVYEVSVLSVLGLDESDAISKTLYTLPDPPTDVRAVNVSDSGALLLWRPALAAVDKYTIVYGAGTDSEVRVTVSGNTAEQQLNDLEPSTTYSVTISSEVDARRSREATTSFTTSGSSGPGDLRATNVTPRTATLSWKPPARPVLGYRVTYWTEGQRKEVSVGAMVTQLNLTRLFPGFEYSVELQTEGGDEVLTTAFTTGSLRFPFPSDCSQEQLNGVTVSGLVDIFPLGQQGAVLSVWCDMDTDGGGWTVFQRRKDGSVDFFRSWKEYVQGFGDPSGEFWLGLDALHTLTSRSRMTLRVDLSDGQDSAFAQYSTFEVAKRNYRLTVGGYSGTAGDSMAYHNNRIFSTKDRDPASFVTRCAMSYRGGWWYKNCHEANLNGLYGISSKHQGIIWTSWKGKEASIPFTEMKMRPTDFYPNKNNYRA